MYKQYSLQQANNGTLTGGGSEQTWTYLWEKSKLSTDKQILTLRKTPQWREISRLFNPGEIVLEAGCGLGSWVRFLYSQGLIPTGLDYSLATIERLRKSYPDFNWIYGNIQRMDFNDETFHHLVSWGVIEHLEEGIEQALREFFRVLKPGGYLFLTVPWISPVRLLTGYSKCGDNLDRLPSGKAQFHQYFFTKQELHELVESAGFSVIKICHSSIHAKTLLPISFRRRFPLATKIFNRLLSPILPDRLIASMILLVGKKEK